MLHWIKRSSKSDQAHKVFKTDGLEVLRHSLTGISNPAWANHLQQSPQLLTSQPAIPAPAGANLLNCLENEKTDSILYRFSLHRPPPPWK
jgi:hypothetical protein